jgi:hypothetical protein
MRASIACAIAVSADVRCATVDFATILDAPRAA